MNMNINFVDEEHEEKYNKLVKKFEPDLEYRTYVVLMYLLAVIDRDGRIDDVIEKRNDSFDRIRVKSDALCHSWVTSGDCLIIRLAFNLFTGRTPTVDKSDSAENQNRELRRYTPANLFNGLDRRCKNAAFEALRIYLNWI